MNTLPGRDAVAIRTDSKIWRGVYQRNTEKRMSSFKARKDLGLRNGSWDKTE